MKPVQLPLLISVTLLALAACGGGSQQESQPSVSAAATRPVDEAASAVPEAASDAASAASAAAAASEAEPPASETRRVAQVTRPVAGAGATTSATSSATAAPVGSAETASASATGTASTAPPSSGESLPLAAPVLGSASSEEAGPNVKRQSVTAAAPLACKVEVWRKFGTQCKALAATVIAHGETMSFANTVTGYRGEVSASCNNGFLQWSSGICNAIPAEGARTAMGESFMSGDSLPDLSAKPVLVSRPPYFVLHRNGSRRVTLAPYPRKDEVARTHDLVGAWFNPTTKRPNALTVQVPIAVNGVLKHVNLSEVSSPLFVQAGSPARAQLVTEGLRTAYVANDPSSSEKLRVQINAYPIPTRQNLIWDLSLKFGGNTAAERWPLTKYTTSPVLLWQLKVDPGFPSMGLMADTDPADPTKLMLVFFQRLNNVNAYSYRWTVNGLAPGAFHDIVVAANLDDRETDEGGVGNLRVWVNGQLVAARQGRNLIRDLTDAHRWAFGLYQAAESNPVALNKTLIWRRARVLTD